jgi:hypothetical protein
MAAKIDLKKSVQKVSLSKDFYKLQCPFAMSISGPSQVGKSHFILNLVKNRTELFTAKFTRIIYCQPESLSSTRNDIFEKIKIEVPFAELIYDLPKLNDLHLQTNNSPCLLIIDDLMSSFLNSNEMSQLLSVHVHHANITCIFTLQNYFHPSRFGKTMIRNVHYRVLFYNRVEQCELRHVSLQITPSFPNFLSSCFAFLQKYYPTSYSQYILIDGHSQSKMSDMHIRSNIFPDSNSDIKPIIFFPNTKGVA